MSLLSPERWIWLAAALPIIGFYLLRTRVRRQSVATLQFWDDANEPTRRRSLSLRLRHWLSLLLQLAFVLLLVAALVDPVRSGQEDASRVSVLVLDTSASMQAQLSEGNDRSRWDAAVEAALRQVEAARPGDRWALVTAGSPVEVVVGVTDFPPAVRDAIQGLHVTDGPDRLDEAIATARRLIPEAAQHRLMVLTDGCGKRDADGENAAADDGVQTLLFGEAVANTGITQMQVRRSLIDSSEYAVLVHWGNFGNEPVAGRLLLRQDDRLLDVHPFQLAPDQVVQETFRYASTGGGIVTAELETDDAFPLDDTAHAVLPDRGQTRVTLVTDTNSLFLPNALSAMSDVELTITDRWIPQAIASELTVLHHVVPDPLPPGPLLVVAPRENSALWERLPTLQETIVEEQAEESLLLANVDLANAFLSEITPLELSASATPLLKTAEGATFMASIDQPSRRVVIFAADLDQSDLPLRVAFPVMISNAVRWLTNTAAPHPSAIATGAMSRLPSFEATDEDWVAKGPVALQRANQDLPEPTEMPIVADDRGAVAGPFSQVGVYELVQPTRSAQADSSRDTLPLAVNLFSAAESDLRPRIESARSEPSDLRDGTTHPYWFYFSLAAFGLLVGEWYLFQRRVVA